MTPVRHIYVACMIAGLAILDCCSSRASAAALVEVAAPEKTAAAPRASICASVAPARDEPGLQKHAQKPGACVPRSGVP